jgi:hypothetical protein
MTLFQKRRSCHSRSSWTVSETSLSLADIVRCVARPSKGDRAAYMVRARDGLARQLADRVAATGVSSLSQYVADLLAIHVGLPNLVRELNRAAVADTARRAVTPPRANRLMIRPVRQVSDRLAHMALEAGYPPGRVSPYIGDVLAEHVGLHPRLHTTAAAAANREQPGVVQTDSESATATATGRLEQAVTGREAARAEMRRLAQRAAQRRAEEAAREATRREAAVRAVRQPQPE